MLAFDTVPRERYENALDEIAHLRLELNDAESRRRRAEQSLKKLEESNGRMRERVARARSIVQEIVQRLG